MRASILILFFGISAFSFAQSDESRKQYSAYSQMISAATRAHDGQRMIYLHKHALGLFDKSLDPNHTGMIGEEYSPTTTTLGALKAKRTATNPDFAAYLVRLFSEHGITKKDCVLVTMTGSFPGLNLAMLSALEILDIPSLRICSIGASSYGANHPDMTWIDMEDILVREKLLLRRLDYATLGGTGDVGKDLTEDAQTKLRKKCARLGYPLLESESTQHQLEIRRELLGDPRAFDLLINIGGNQLMLGSGDELRGGWIEPKSKDWQKSKPANPGIIYDYLEAGIPVLNLLHIEDIAKEADLPFDPQPLPRIGASAIYFRN